MSKEPPKTAPPPSEVMLERLIACAELSASWEAFLEQAAEMPPEALAHVIREKLEAGETNGLWEVAKLVQLHPAQRSFALEQAARFHVDRRLEEWLNDPRL